MTVFHVHKKSICLIIIVFGISVLILQLLQVVRVSPSIAMQKWALDDPFSAYRIKADLRIGKKTSNTFGFVSTPEISMEKREEELRVLFLGGSSTAGVGKMLDDKDTWPWQVWQQLQNQFPDKDITFINAAAPGYTSFESYGSLWSRLRFFNPDIIVMYHGWNELYYFSQLDTIDQWRLHEYSSAEGQIIGQISQRFFAKTNDENSPHKEILNDIDERGFNIWRGNVQLIQAAADIIGAELFVAKQATLITDSTIPEDKERIRYEFVGLSHDALVKGFEGIYTVIDEEIPADHIIDTTILSGESDMFHDHIHPTVQGAERIADIVADALKASVLR